MSVNVALGGTAQFIVGGALYSLAGSMKIDPGGVIKTPAIGPSGPTGNWVEKVDPPLIEVEIFDDPAISVTALRDQVGVTVQLQMKNGKLWLLRNGFVSGKVDIDAVTGKYTMNFSGTTCQEQLAT